MVPKANTYNILVKGHCERKDFTRAYVWYREMADNSFLLNACTCNELTIGLPKEGRLQEAQIVYSEMKVKLMDDWSTANDLSAVAKYRCLVWLSSQHHNLSTKRNTDIISENLFHSSICIFFRLIAPLLTLKHGEEHSWP